MHKFEKGWVIKDKNGDYLENTDTGDFFDIYSALIFKRKKDALEDIENAGLGGETVVKIEREIIIKFV